MGEQRVRVMVGEGQTSRKGQLRFVLENEGYEVVAEATSTLELAQRLVIHRPDVVVLDDGIDASAVGMLREVLPSAKVILVWPRGVAAVGVEARLEPSEVMTSLGSTVARVMGRGPLISPPRPRLAPPGVIVVPEPEGPPEPGRGEEPGLTTRTTVPPADVDEEATDVAVAPDVHDVISTEPEPLAHVLMRPGDVATPAWTYTAPETEVSGGTGRKVAVWALAAVVTLLAVALGVTLWNSSLVQPQIVAGSLNGYTIPVPGPGPEITTDQPGTFEGIVHVRADGSIHLQASGDISLRIDGSTHVVATGNVKVSGDGVVNNVSSRKVRVRGNGTIRITVGKGHIRVRLQGTVTAQGEGTVRIGGVGRFLITHRPV